MDLYNPNRDLEWWDYKITFPIIAANSEELFIVVVI